MGLQMELSAVRSLPQGMDALVRASKAEDFLAIEKLVREFDNGNNRFDAPGEVLFSAQVGDALVGVCGLNVDPYLEDPSVGRVRHLYVAPQWRRGGVGRALVSEVLHHAQGRFTRVRLRTLRDDAAQFYLSIGFDGGGGEPACTHSIEPPFFLSRTQSLQPTLSGFLAGRVADFHETLRWGSHAVQLQGYLTTDAPPREYVLAARGLVRRADSVLLCRNARGQHILPGGRIEPGETAEQALRRELLEETGWEVEVGPQLALLHVYYETPEPTDVGRVIYPDFLWQVFCCAPAHHRPELKRHDDYELGGDLRPLEEVRTHLRSRMERELLRSLT